jgi:SAM-dependent methyltransferase
VNKAGIINHLAAVHGYRNYLELCTLTTGARYQEIDRSKLSRRRLMYRCPDDYEDGDPVDYRSPDCDISACLQAIRGEKRRFDIALIDSFHEYGTSLRDLAEGFDLLREGGSLVVHDCLPPTRAIAQPTYLQGSWCGVSYEAYIDFVDARDDLAFYTVDTDYGCGVIRKRAGNAFIRLGRRLLRAFDAVADGEGRRLMQEWRTLKGDHARRFDVFERHKRTLLNLISVDEFFAREKLTARRAN